MKVYEVCDTSNDEMYFPLGIFATLREAKDAIAKAGTDPVTETGENEDFEQIKVIERELGWSGNHGKEVLVIDRERIYDESADAWVFKKLEQGD